MPLDIYVILNAYSGSGTRIVDDSNSPLYGKPKGFDQNYSDLIQLLGREKIRWLGYIAANYAAPKLDNPISEDVKFWLDAYKTADGIFIDECPSDAASIDPMREIATTIRAEFAKRGKERPLLVANPGTVCAGEYASLFDGICMFERPWDGKEPIRPGWALDPVQRFSLSVLPYGVSSKEQLQEMLNQAIVDSTKFVFFSDQLATQDTVLWTQIPRQDLLESFGAAVLHWNRQVVTAGGVLPTRQEMFKNFLAAPK